MTIFCGLSVENPASCFGQMEHKYAQIYLIVFSTLKMKDILQLPHGLYAILANIVRMGLHLFRNFHQHIINILTPHEEDSRFLTVNVRKLSMRLTQKGWSLFLYRVS